MTLARQARPARAFALAILTALAALHSTVTRAQPAASEGASTSAHDRALALFEQSVAAYRAGRFADAATLLREAYGLEPAPVLQYNLARALDADGQLVAARDAYRRYLAEEPDADQRASCERRIEVLTTQIDASEAASAQAAPGGPTVEGAAPEATSTSGPPASSGPDLTAPMVVVGLGAAIAIGGGVLVGVGSERHGVAVLEPVSLRAAEIESEALVLRDAGVALLAIGGAAVAAGAIWATVASFEAGETEVEARIGPTGVSVRSRF